MTDLADAAERLLGSALVSATKLQGGDLSSVAMIRLQDGREAVVKSGPAPRIEAAMLNALAAAGLRTPDVLAADDALLALAPIVAAGTVQDAWQDLGTQLAKLHRTTGPNYGWPQDYAFGPVAIANSWSDDWPAFYARNRLLTHTPYLAAPLARRIETLAAGLAERLPHTPPAALLHGDLWSGNVLVADGRVAAFIDPACCYGHAETDLAMLAMFDRPGSAFFEAYGPLSAGHRERLPIYQLWPALVHLRLFGDGYRSLVEALLNKAGV